MSELKKLFSGLWGAISGLLTSKKFWYAIGTAGAGVYCERKGCDKSQLLVTLTGIGAIIGQGLADFGKHSK